ncbi:MAG TPA: CU044_2847 family protein [Candidatus Acidoferrum sp.]|nr:CU044_2847 family protein [Candidatus Acidoferrum sp.]
MSQFAQFPLKDGGFLVVEVAGAESPGSRVMRGSAAEDAIAKATDTFESALENVRSAAEGILHQLRSLAQPPDEVAVEFGVKMSAESGAIIAKASGEANFKINLTWKKSPAGK